MLQAKLQFEVRYSYILNFQQESRKILSPYLRLANVNISNIDTSEEHIVLIFKEENYYIDARWDRLILAYEGGLDSVEEFHHITMHFFEILHKLAKLETFGKIINSILARFLIKEIEGDDKTVKREFRKKYYTSNVPSLEGEEQDFAIVIENKKDKDYTKITFGPFDADKDIPRLKLYSINPSLSSNIVEIKGLLFEALQATNSSKVDFDTFKKLYTQQRRILNSFV